MLLLVCVTAAAGQESLRPITSEQRDALIAVYRSSNGDHWIHHDRWLDEPGTECSWYGVTCDQATDGRATVESLDLSENNLSGSIPAEIVAFANLRWLYLFGNHLSGMLPAGMISRWLAGELVISVDAALLTDITEVDYEFSPSALLCGSERIVFHADRTAIMFTKKCRNATVEDRHTFCEVKQGKIYSFAMLAQVITKEEFFRLRKKYELNVTDAAFEATRVVRSGKSHEVVEYAGGVPLQLWTINRAIEGTAASVEWEQITTRSSCPRWSDVQPVGAH